MAASYESRAFEESHSMFVDSLTSVAIAMRNAANVAESFSRLLQNSSFSQDKKSLKRKAVSLEDGVASAPEDDSKDKDKDGKQPDQKKKKKAPRDPNAPKRPPSSYILFQNDIRREIKEQHPGINNADLLGIIAKKWGEMSDEDKAIYHKAVADAKAQYSNEKKAYDARSPEEVAAAKAATEAALAAKKALPRGRKPKVATISTPASAGITADPTGGTAPAAPTTTSPTTIRQPPTIAAMPASAGPEESSSEETSESGDEEVPKNVTVNPSLATPAHVAAAAAAMSAKAVKSSATPVTKNGKGVKEVVPSSDSDEEGSTESESGGDSEDEDEDEEDEVQKVVVQPVTQSSKPGPKSRTKALATPAPQVEKKKKETAVPKSKKKSAK